MCKESYFEIYRPSDEWSQILVCLDVIDRIESIFSFLLIRGGWGATHGALVLPTIFQVFPVVEHGYRLVFQIEKHVVAPPFRACWHQGRHRKEWSGGPAKGSGSSNDGTSRLLQ